MDKWLKTTLKITGITLLTPILACLLIMYFVDPNQYKAKLSETVQQKTGYHLEIQGPLKWQWLSSFGLALKAPDIKVSAPKAPAVAILKAKELNIGIELFPLLVGKVLFNAEVIEPSFPQSSEPKTFSNFTLAAEWTYKELLNRNDQTLILKNLKLKIQDPELPFVLRGNFRMNLSADYAAEGDLQIPNKELNAWLRKFAPAFQPKLNLSQPILLQFKYAAPVLTITQLSIPFDNQGQLQGQFQVDLAKVKQAIYGIKGNLKGEKLQFNQIPISSLNTSLALTAQGSGVDALKKTLSGQVKMQLLQGKIPGVDLVYLLKHAQTTSYALATSLKEKKLVNIASALKDEGQYWLSQRKQPNAVTPFDEIRVTLTFNQGVMQNQDLLVAHRDYQITGKGSVNLQNNTINYAAYALAKTSDIKQDDKIATFLKTTEIPILIKSDIRNPSIHPDFSGYVNYIVRSATEEQVEKFIGDTVKKLIKIKM